MPGIHDTLRSAVQAAKARGSANPSFFACIAKAGDGALLIGASKPSAALIDAAKKEVGGGTVFAGTCFGDAGQFIFETPSEPPATLTACIRTCLKKYAGITASVEVRAKSDRTEEVESSEDHSEEHSAPVRDAAKPAPDKARIDRIAARVKAVQTRLVAAGTSAADTARAAKTKLDQAAAAYRAAHLDQAESLLHEAETIIAALPR